MAPVEMQGFGASKNFKARIYYRPEWFVKGFAPETLLKVEGGKKMHGTYCANIAQEGGISTLLGLCGLNEELLGVVADNLFNVGIEKLVDGEGNFIDAQVVEAVTQVLHETLVSDRPVGYIVGQQWSKTGRQNSEGKEIRIRSKYEEIKEWFDATDDKVLAKLVKRAAKNAKAIEDNTDDTKIITPFITRFDLEASERVPY
jgi:hypothetical protein